VGAVMGRRGKFLPNNYIFLGDAGSENEIIKGK
jgi:hypothetical protein